MLARGRTPEQFAELMQSETGRAIISQFNEKNLANGSTLREAKVVVPEQMWTQEEAKETVFACMVALQRAWSRTFQELGGFAATLKEHTDSVTDLH